MIRAHGHESVDLSWGDVEFRATKNPLPKPGLLAGGATDKTDANDGDDTACTLHAVVHATADKCLRPDALPTQGEIFTDADGFRYRVTKIDYTPGLPPIVFHIPNVVS